MNKGGGKRMGHRKKQLVQCQRAKKKIAKRTVNGARRRAKLEVKVQEVSTVSMEPLTVTGERNQTSQTMKMTFISAWQIPTLS